MHTYINKSQIRTDQYRFLALLGIQRGSRRRTILNVIAGHSLLRAWLTSSQPIGSHLREDEQPGLDASRAEGAEPHIGVALGAGLCAGSHLEAGKIASRVNPSPFLIVFPLNPNALPLFIGSHGNANVRYIQIQWGSTAHWVDFIIALSFKSHWRPAKGNYLWLAPLLSGATTNTNR